MRIVHKDGGVKTADEIIDFIEGFDGVKLMPYQKLFVKAIYGAKTNTFITMPTHLGYTPIKNIISAIKDM